MELKVWRPGQSDPLDEGLRQHDAYLDRLGLDRGTLVVFDRIAFGAAETASGRPVTLLRA